MLKACPLPRSSRSSGSTNRYANPWGIKDLDPKAFRFEDAAGVSVFTCQRLALPQRVYLMLHDLLTRDEQ